MDATRFEKRGSSRCKLLHLLILISLSALSFPSFERAPRERERERERERLALTVLLPSQHRKIDAFFLVVLINLFVESAPFNVDVLRIVVVVVTPTTLSF